MVSEQEFGEVAKGRYEREVMADKQELGEVAKVRYEMGVDSEAMGSKAGSES